jgi:spermidine/putrescine transport system permease protein
MNFKYFHITGLFIYLFCVYLFIFAPVISLLIISIYSGSDGGFVFNGLSLKWFRMAISDQEFSSSLTTSLAVGFLVAPVSTILGLGSAHYICRTGAKYPIAYSAVICLPGFVPLVLSGISFLIYFQQINLYGTELGIALAHICYCSPFAFIVIFLGYINTDKNIELAAINLGASKTKVFFFIILPQLRRPILAAFLLSLLLSWDEFVIPYFIGGFVKTLPVMLYSAMANNLSPSVYAMGVVAMCVSAVLLFAVAWLLNFRGVMIDDRDR